MKGGCTLEEEVATLAYSSHLSPALGYAKCQACVKAPSAASIPCTHLPAQYVGFCLCDRLNVCVPPKFIC